MKTLTIAGLIYCLVLPMTAHAATVNLGKDDAIVVELASMAQTLPPTKQIACKNGGQWQQFSDSRKAHFLYSEGNTPIMAIRAPDEGAMSVITKDDDTWWDHKVEFQNIHISGATLDWIIRTTVDDDEKGIETIRPQTIARCFASFWMN